MARAAFGLVALPSLLLHRLIIPADDHSQKISLGGQSGLSVSTPLIPVLRGMLHQCIIDPSSLSCMSRISMPPIVCMPMR